jgi:hypothetical protein
MEARSTKHKPHPAFYQLPGSGQTFHPTFRVEGEFTMAFKKSASPAIEISQARLTALSSIDPALDLGNDLTLANYQAAMQAVQAKLTAYHTLLSQADDAANVLRDAEKELNALNVRMLLGVAAKYGKNSSQYEVAGGTRTSEIKRSPKKKKTAA